LIEWILEIVPEVISREVLSLEDIKEVLLSEPG